MKIKWLIDCEIEVTETGDLDDIIIEQREVGTIEEVDIFFETTTLDKKVKLVQFQFPDGSITAGVDIAWFDIIEE